MDIKRGKYIVLEGMPGSGKTTLGKEISKNNRWHYFKSLPSNRVLIEIEENYKNISQKNNRQLRNLLFAANLIEDEYKIKKIIDDGKNVIRDKSIASSLAHLYTQVEMDESLSVEIRIFLENISLEFYKPDLIIFLDTSFENCSFYKNLQEDLSNLDNLLFSQENKFNLFKEKIQYFLKKHYKKNAINFKRENMNPSQDANRILNYLKEDK